MHGLDDIAVFVKVVQAGSFTGAARLLAMPITTVSAKVAALEARLQTTLIRRTTRKLYVTPAGEAYFRRCVVALEEIQSAENELSESEAAPRGTLRITAGVDLGQTLLPAIVLAFLKEYPAMKLDLVITNRVVDLVSEGVDIGIRAGALADSSLISRRLVSSTMGFWAAPGYLKKHGVPSHPRELSRHQYLKFTPAGNSVELASGESKFVLEQSGKLACDDLSALKNLIVLGAGIGVLPGFLVEEEARKGKLVPILEKWSWGKGHFSLVYPAQKFVAPKIHAFAEVAARVCAGYPRPL